MFSYRLAPSPMRRLGLRLRDKSDAALAVFAGFALAAVLWATFR